MVDSRNAMACLHAEPNPRSPPSLVAPSLPKYEPRSIRYRCGIGPRTESPNASYGVDLFKPAHQYRSAADFEEERTSTGIAKFQSCVICPLVAAREHRSSLIIWSDHKPSQRSSPRSCALPKIEAATLTGSSVFLVLCIQSSRCSIKRPTI